MALRDRVLDEALAIAKACSHAEVEPRHVLWGIVRALGSEAPADLKPADIRAILDPPGTAVSSPSVSAGAQSAVDACDSAEAAIAQARTITAQLGAAAPVTGAPIAARASEASSSADGTKATSTATSAESPPDGTSSSSETVDAILAELDALVGLAPVKTEVRRLVALQRLNAARRTTNLPEVSATNHLVFTGDPGTGKTTVARVIARLYGALGVVSRGHLVEATRADLVAGYVGQTALKVQEVVSSAVGGVLFIDEAYALSRGEFQDFGGEAVATLVKLMEDYRQNLAVIVAGYPDEMWEFIRSNPGLRSRFTRYIHFPNFNATELTQIFEALADQAKVLVGDGVSTRVRELLAEAQSVEDFGNARFVRSMFERAYGNMAARVIADDRIDPEELEIMMVGDLPAVETSGGGHSRRIGFRPG